EPRPRNRASRTALAKSAFSQSVLLIPRLFVDDIDPLATVRQSDQVVIKNLNAALLFGSGSAGEVRGDDVVFRCPEWALGVERFLLGDTDTGAGDLARVQGVCQGVFIDDPATRDRDQ